MSNVPEMSFFESFRIIDANAEAAIKLREASRVIQKNGSDLKLWEEKAKIVKDKINRELAEVKTHLCQARLNSDARLATLGKKELEARDSIQPMLQDAAGVKEKLDKLNEEYSQARADMARFIENSATEKVRIIADGISNKENIIRHNNLLIDAAEKRLAAIDEAITLAKEGVNEL